MMLAVASQVAVAQSSVAQASVAPTVESNKSPQAVSPLTYAWVVTGNVQVYANPGDLTPVRDLGKGFLYVSVTGAPIVVGDQTWYQINQGEYVNAKDIRLIRPSSFHGITLTATPDKPFGWMVYAAKPSPSAGAASAADAKTINRYTTITAFEETKVGDVTWYRISDSGGDNQWVDQKKVALVFPHARPDGVAPTDKWIDINKFEQTLAAYEGDTLVYATLVSSGLPQWDTDSGLFRVYMKVKQAKMSGREGKSDYYFLEDVPYAMYFNQDMALHGAYWHDKFGFKHSHGCVNLPVADSLWLWNWTTPDSTDKSFTMVADRNNNTEGTWVWVHD